MTERAGVGALLLVLAFVLAACGTRVAVLRRAEMASAAQPGSAEAGKRIAETWCASCHQIAPDAPANDAAPSFPSLVREREGGDLSWARGFLFDPHPPMEGIRLSNREIDDIVAYLKSLAASPGDVP